MATKKKATRAKAKPKKASAKKGMDQAAMMEAWMKASTPSEAHQRLDAIVGKFRARTTFVMAPGDPEQTSDATSDHAWVLGGRFVEQRYKGASMGMPFEGLGYTGYDNVQKQYIGVWMDTFGTGLMPSAGVGRPSAKEIKFLAHAVDPTGRKLKFETSVKIKDRDHHTFEMWTFTPGGKRFRTMIAEYTRI